MGIQHDGSGDLNFEPAGVNEAEQSTGAESTLFELAEQSIINTIMCEELSDSALRFIRYLLSISRAARFGFLPNFADLTAVREIARQFIHYCGSAALALYTMNQVIEGEA